MSNHEQSHESKSSSHEAWKDKLKGKKAIIAAIAAGILVVGVSGALLANGGGNHNPSGETQTQNQTDALSPEEARIKQEMSEKSKLSIDEIRARYESKMPSGEQITADFKIPSGLSDEELTKVFSDRLSSWMTCGYDSLLRDEYLHESTNRETFVDSRLSGIASSCQKYIVAGLFSEKASQLSNVTVFAKDMQDKNAYNLDLRVLTDDGSSENQEPYRIYFTPRQTSNVTPSGVDPSIRVLSFSLLEKANIDKNRADDDFGATTIDTVGKEKKFRLTFTDNGANTTITGFSKAD